MNFFSQCQVLSKMTLPIMDNNLNAIVYVSYEKNVHKSKSILQNPIVFPNQKVGSDYNEDAKNSLVYLLPYSTAVGKLYFHFWRGGSYSQENINFRRIEREWYKAQMIQSTYDGKICRQSVKINGLYVYQKTLACPSLKSGVKEIYTTGNQGDSSKSQIRNFQFFSHPL